MCVLIKQRENQDEKGNEHFCISVELYNNLQSQYKELQESYDEYRGIQHIYK